MSCLQNVHSVNMTYCSSVHAERDLLLCCLSEGFFPLSPRSGFSGGSFSSIDARFWDRTCRICTDRCFNFQNV